MQHVFYPNATNILLVFYLTVKNMFLLYIYYYCTQNIFIVATHVLKGLLGCGSMCHVLKP